MLHGISTARQYASQKLKSIRDELRRKFPEGNFAIIAVGSYGRAEASDESDLDWFVLGDAIQSPNLVDCHKTAQDVLLGIVPKAPSATGAFNGVQEVEKMLHDIGGDDETNSLMTRRVLLMLESTWLYNESYKEDIIRQLMDRYIREDLSDDKMALFFLNDCIRYWRTICVDFEFKTTHQGKTWGDRSIKLRFSRKLLYFGGIVAAAETWRLSPGEKRKRVCELLALDPIERIQSIFGSKADAALRHYDFFLERMSQRSVRDELMRVKRFDVPQDEALEYSKLKRRSHDFSRELELLLRGHYDSSHPVHSSLVF